MSKKMETKHFTERERSDKIKKNSKREQKNGRIYQMVGMSGRHKTAEQGKIFCAGDRADRILFNTVEGRKLGRP